MLYALLQYLERTFEPVGFQVFRFITVRASLAAITALLIALVVGRRIIRWLQAQQMGERVREGVDAGAVNHAHKAGTPTMGGVILLLAVLGSALLWSDLTNLYVWLPILATALMGAVGFGDDYIKVVMKDKKGLAPRVKIIGQVGVGLLVGLTLYFFAPTPAARTLTQLPFYGTFDFAVLTDWIAPGLGWIVYVPMVVFVMTAMTNAVNLTDGLDGLATGVTAFVALGLLALVYVSGNAIAADFLNVLHLPGTGELTIFAAALALACFGFLWFNGYPASVFMGDTGSLALGAAVTTLALCVRKELLLPIMGIVYVAETLSVVLQTSYFKYTRKKTGTGKRIFKMAPLHHHFEASGLHEAKIATRFWIVTAIATIAALLTLRAQ